MNRNSNWYVPDREVANIKWCMEDIKILFEQNNIPFTEESYNILLDQRFKKTLEDRSIEEGDRTVV